MDLETARDDGGFLLSLPTGRDYALNVTSQGYLFYPSILHFQANTPRKIPS